MGGTECLTPFLQIIPYGNDIIFRFTLFNKHNVRRSFYERKKITFFVLILFFVSVATVFASPKEGYYHNGNEETIGITDLGNGVYYVVMCHTAF
jgi:hypothetical protein